MFRPPAIIEWHANAAAVRCWGIALPQVGGRCGLNRAIFYRCHCSVLTEVEPEESEDLMKKPVEEMHTTD